MGEHCCKNEAVELNYGHPGKMTARNPMLGDDNSISHIALQQALYKQEADKIRAKTNRVMQEETSHPAFPHHKGDISKCPVMGAGMKAVKEGIDWHAKYLQAQRDLVEEAGRWSKRLQDLEVAYAEKIMRVQQEYEDTMQEGYEEAYKIVMAERNKAEQNMMEAEKVAEQGYAEAYNIIKELRETNADLSEQVNSWAEHFQDEDSANHPDQSADKC